MFGDGNRICNLMGREAYLRRNIDGLVQNCCNSSALAMELLQFCTMPLIYILIKNTPWHASLITCMSTHCAHIGETVLTKLRCFTWCLLKWIFVSWGLCLDWSVRQYHGDFYWIDISSPICVLRDITLQKGIKQTSLVKVRSFVIAYHHIRML